MRGNSPASSCRTTVNPFDQKQGTRLKFNLTDESARNARCWTRSRLLVFRQQVASRGYPIPGECSRLDSRLRMTPTDAVSTVTQELAGYIAGMMARDLPADVTAKT